mmetsp:Transcript_768/g.1279  ORF Transcript_768/g.1279 Transcript_768/m.1279 type:complete len:645 (+) Transcript_768:172-2106(+)|eukprot:CAMPEP_0185040178 /NCGR_PEP_ID=MMETSP1103-20130426/37938_1 /TAXON_ID=36769 /ORGANISM="Paraphysomonas bandaiensis, Strain Caron Lab Isolate" /LENGTH=644 /DNA_ID=CAMNT_0027579371 /DNA_START=95 /DNA_END=2029 /DNA_ORIENTATION=+
MEDELSGYSQDDLIFEVKRLRQRVQVLENDKKIMEEEFAIAQTGSADSAIHTNQDTAKLKDQLYSMRNMLTMYVQKYRVVQTFLELERKTLREIRSEVDSCYDTTKKDVEQKLNLVVKAVQSREYALQKRLQKMTNDLFKEKERKEHLVIEASELKKERNLISKSLENVQKEFAAEKEMMKEHFDRISKKIEDYQQEHAHEVQAMRNEIADKDKAQVELEGNNCKLRKQIKSMQEEHTVLFSKNEELSVALRAHSEDAENWRRVRKTLEEKIAELDNQISDSKTKGDTECEKLKDQIRVLNDQLEKMMANHDALTNDFNSVLAREESLRMELHGNSNDKSDMQRKLRSINEKLKEMEALHSEETAALRDHILEEERKASAVAKELSKEKQRADGAAAELTRAQQAMLAKDGEIKSRDEELNRLRGVVGDLERKVKSFERELSAGESSIASLRSDRDDALASANTLKEALSASAVKVDELECEVQRLQEEVRNLREELSRADHSVLEKLRCQVSEKEVALAEGQEEIAKLKDTIRRECEERTEMMLEMSELRDQIRRLSSLNLRSQSSSSAGVEVAMQTPSRPHYSASATTYENPTSKKSSGVSMLKQLSTDGGSSMTDSSWAQKLAKQGTAGINKSKRKSKYRS